MKMFFTLIFLLLINSSLSLAADIRAIVTGVHDGDTLAATATTGGVKYKIRLMGVDTPEVDFFKKSQGDVAFKAREYLKQLAPVGSEILIIDGSNSLDKHGRILGRIKSNGQEINQEMLRQGWGLPYFIYPFDKRIVSDYIKASKEAYENRRGLFSIEHEDTEEPYLFRMSSRNQVGINPVGDFELKKVFAPEDIDQIPVWRRVFFPNLEMAYSNGYK